MFVEGPFDDIALRILSIDYLSFFLSSSVARFKANCGVRPLRVEYPNVEDEDVIRERERVKASEGEAKPHRGTLRFVNLKKVFPPKKRGGPVNVAVNNMSLDVYVVCQYYSGDSD